MNKYIILNTETENVNIKKNVIIKNSDIQINKNNLHSLSLYIKLLKLIISSLNITDFNLQLIILNNKKIRTFVLNDDFSYKLLYNMLYINFNNNANLLPIVIELNIILGDSKINLYPSDYIIKQIVDNTINKKNFNPIKEISFYNSNLYYFKCTLINNYLFYDYKLDNIRDKSTKIIYHIKYDKIQKKFIKRFYIE